MTLLIISLSTILLLLGIILIKISIKNARFLFTIKREINIYIVLVSIVLILTSSILLILLFDNTSRNFNSIVKTEGILFIIVISTISVIGAIYTVKNVHEMRGTINNYRDYLHNANWILDNIKNHAGNNQELRKHRIRILSYSPFHGNISIRNDDAYKEYRSNILSIAEKANLEIICLHHDTQNDLISYSKDLNNTELLPKYLDLLNEIFKSPDLTNNEMWNNKELSPETFKLLDKIFKSLDLKNSEMWKFYKGYTERKKIAFDKSISDYYKDIRKSDNIFRKSHLQVLIAYLESVSNIDKIRTLPNCKVYPKKFAELPSFHFILTDYEAIVGMPLKLPFPTLYPYYLDDPLTDSQVEMIGYRTIQQNIIQELNRTFDYYTKIKCQELRLGKNDMYAVEYYLETDHEFDIPLLCVHGITGDHNERYNYFNHITLELAKLSAKEKSKHLLILRYDALGIGKSKNKKYDLPTIKIEDFKSSVAEGLDHLRKRMGKDYRNRIIIVARGMGAFFSITKLTELADHYTEIVLILWAPIFYPHRTFQRRNKISRRGKVLECWIGDDKASPVVFSDDFIASAIGKDDELSNSLPILSSKIKSILILHPSESQVCSEEDINIFVSQLKKTDFNITNLTQIRYEDEKHLDSSYISFRTIVFETLKFIESLKFGGED